MASRPAVTGQLGVRPREVGTQVGGGPDDREPPAGSGGEGVRAGRQVQGSRQEAAPGRRRPAVGDREQDDVVATRPCCARCSGAAATWSRPRRPGGRRSRRSAVARPRGPDRPERAGPGPTAANPRGDRRPVSVSWRARARSDAAYGAMNVVGLRRRSVRTTIRRPAARLPASAASPTAVPTAIPPRPAASDRRPDVNRSASGSGARGSRRDIRRRSTRRSSRSRRGVPGIWRCRPDSDRPGRSPYRSTLRPPW